MHHLYIDRKGDYNMNYSKIIRISGYEAITKKIDDLKKYTSEHVQEPPMQDADQLDGKEARLVMDYLFDLEKEYFSDIPLSTDIVKNFVYNIPKNVYNVFEEMMLKEATDIFNPMLMLYPFFMEDPENIVLFVDKINNMIGPDEMNFIESFKESEPDNEEET